MNKIDLQTERNMKKEMIKRKRKHSKKINVGKKYKER